MAKEQPLFGLQPRSLRPDQATASGHPLRRSWTPVLPTTLPSLLPGQSGSRNPPLAKTITQREGKGARPVSLALTKAQNSPFWTPLAHSTEPTLATHWAATRAGTRRLRVLSVTSCPSASVLGWPVSHLSADRMGEVNGRPDCGGGHARAPESGNQQSPGTERPGETAGQSGGSGI